MADFVHEGVEMVQNASTEYGRRLKHTRFKKMWLKRRFRAKISFPTYSCSTSFSLGTLLSALSTSTKTQ